MSLSEVALVVSIINGAVATVLAVGQVRDRLRRRGRS